MSAGAHGGVGPLTVDTRDPTPPYEQLRQQLAGLIATGRLPPGERLPPLRQLAADLGLAVGTVARTYRELETAGLVVSRRGGGTRVARTSLPVAPPARRDTGEALRGAAAAFVRAARACAATDAELRQALEAALVDDPAGSRTGGQVRVAGER
ncbi:GntR family transcriptional regulator [Geodermatophilus sp. YIM 151500]|uniref:GntR family transcriptional regulator n=1 Tax=Geodermatophilus sp. YIM 151500 TaxID=2984531 RepID=UPI0021E4B532|nr:GntR family transcriptional regulator [Geodermatophilus sp. YIM 151500]MCV2488970.1 GntR family transcriptional regulator [Geodermatophilus sp. YIM 151500]